VRLMSQSKRIFAYIIGTSRSIKLIDPHCKNRLISATLWRCRKRAIFTMEKFFTLCRIWMKFRLRVCLKPSNDRCKFELDWARCYKNIAENSFALGHEMDSRLDSNIYSKVYSLVSIAFNTWSSAYWPAV